MSKRGCYFTIYSVLCGRILSSSTCVYGSIGLIDRSYRMTIWQKAMRDQAAMEASTLSTASTSVVIS